MYLTPLIILNEDDILSIALTKDEHQVFTNAWRDAIGYNNSKSLLNTRTATIDDIMRAIYEVYAGY